MASSSVGPSPLIKEESEDVAAAAGPQPCPNVSDGRRPDHVLMEEDGGRKVGESAGGQGSAADDQMVGSGNGAGEGADDGDRHAPERRHYGDEGSSGEDDDSGENDLLHARAVARSPTPSPDGRKKRRRTAGNDVSQSIISLRAFLQKLKHLDGQVPYLYVYANKDGATVSHKKLRKARSFSLSTYHTARSAVEAAIDYRHKAIPTEMPIKGWEGLLAAHAFPDDDQEKPSASAAARDAGNKEQKQKRRGGKRRRTGSRVDSDGDQAPPEALLFPTESNAAAGSDGGGGAAGVGIKQEGDGDHGAAAATGEASGEADASAGAGEVHVKMEVEDDETFVTVELSKLTADDVVKIFQRDEKLRGLVDTVKKEELTGETFAEVLAIADLDSRKASDKVLGSHIKLGKVTLVVNWLRGIDPAAVQVPVSA